MFGMDSVVALVILFVLGSIAHIEKVEPIIIVENTMPNSVAAFLVGLLW